MKNECDKLIDSIGELAVRGTARKAVAYGEHDVNDISGVNILFAVDSCEKFSEVHDDIVFSVFRCGVYGSVEPIEFPNGDSTFYAINLMHLEKATQHYEQAGNTLVSAR